MINTKACNTDANYLLQKKLAKCNSLHTYDYTIICKKDWKYAVYQDNLHPLHISHYTVSTYNMHLLSLFY